MPPTTSTSATATRTPHSNSSTTATTTTNRTMRRMPGATQKQPPVLTHQLREVLLEFFRLAAGCCQRLLGVFERHEWHVAEGPWGREVDGAASRADARPDAGCGSGDGRGGGRGGGDLELGLVRGWWLLVLLGLL